MNPHHHQINNISHRKTIIISIIIIIIISISISIIIIIIIIGQPSSVISQPSAVIIRHSCLLRYSDIVKLISMLCIINWLIIFFVECKWAASSGINFATLDKPPSNVCIIWHH